MRCKRLNPGVDYEPAAGRFPMSTPDLGAMALLPCDSTGYEVVNCGRLFHPLTWSELHACPQGRLLNQQTFASEQGLTWICSPFSLACAVPPRCDAGGVVEGTREIGLR
jgi:hypothetical protein